MFVVCCGLGDVRDVSVGMKPERLGGVIVGKCLDRFQDFRDLLHFRDLVADVELEAVLENDLPEPDLSERKAVHTGPSTQ